jgi:hypothetical protein
VVSQACRTRFAQDGLCVRRICHYFSRVFPTRVTGQLMTRDVEREPSSQEL